MLSNTAKHFVCYSGLIGVVLFLFGLYHKADLQYTASQQQIVDSSTATEKALEDSQKAMAAKDVLLKNANAKLDVALSDAKTLNDQIALVNELLPNLKQPLTVYTEATSNPGLTPPTNSVEQGVILSTDDFKQLTAEVVSCKKCENSLAVSQTEIETYKTDLKKQQDLVVAYQVIQSKQPHTRWQKFWKGIKWVSSLGS